MTTVTFYCAEANQTVNVECQHVYGTDVFDVRLNHYHLETVDGTDITYDVGPTKTHGVIVMKNVSYADKVSLHDFILSGTRFAQRVFRINAIAGVDFGLGKGIVVENARWDGGNSTQGLFTGMAPGVFTVNFPYKFTRG